MDRSRRAATAVVPPFVFSLFFAVAMGRDALAQETQHSLTPNVQSGSQLYFDREARQLLAQQYDLPIPPVSERPVVGGQRIRVIEFNIVGLTERPEHDINAQGINAVLTRNFAVQPLEGWTMFELQQVAEDVTEYYRERGFIVARAFIPAQEVKEGLVTMQIVEG